jgi:alpha-ketoglutarate-dependent taurine dioxygenase
MIDYKIHENGWTIIIEDFDLKKTTQEDVNQIAKLVAKNTVVIFRNQLLDIEDQLRILNMFKNPDIVCDNRYFHELVADPTKDTNGIIIRITGEFRDGVIGGAGWNEEFAWHCDMPELPVRKPIVWLYGVRGTEGSRTSWNNNVLAYEDLSADIKNQIADLHTIYGNISAPEYHGHHGVEYNMEWTPSLVHTNIANRLGMYFSPLQILKFVELSKEESDVLVQTLSEHALQEKYVYHHDWKDGDVILSEQWTGIHRRWAFDKMNQRLLHRAAIDFPDQDYTS